REVVRAAAVRGTQFAAFTAGENLAIAGVEAGEGHDPHLNAGTFAEQTAEAFATGALGGPLAQRWRGPLGEAAAMAAGAVGVDTATIGGKAIADQMRRNADGSDPGSDHTAPPERWDTVVESIGRDAVK